MAHGLNVRCGAQRGDLHNRQRCWIAALMLGTLLGAVQTPVQASDTETRRAMAAIAAFAECKILNAGYSRERAQRILSTWIENKGLQKESEWLQSPQAIRVVALTSEAMNESCNGFDQKSPQFIPAMETIDQL